MAIDVAAHVVNQGFFQRQVFANVLIQLLEGFAAFIFDQVGDQAT